MAEPSRMLVVVRFHSVRKNGEQPPPSAHSDLVAALSTIDAQATAATAAAVSRSTTHKAEAASHGWLVAPFSAAALAGAAALRQRGPNGDTTALFTARA
ncbi:hypothetical protein ACFUEM_15245 [Streptomyces anulatus]|uniref:hypothetical protein n=1 Tax=Streptomyces anulatus TaxID=1892 RepID=UPI0035D91E46